MLAYSTEIALFILLIFTFGFSAGEKLTDFTGNLNWLKTYFKGTFMVKYLKVALIKVVIFEIAATILCILGLVELFTSKVPQMGLYGCILCIVTLFAFLIGQRIVRDYDGARNTVIYLVPSILLLYLLTHL